MRLILILIFCGIGGMSFHQSRTVIDKYFEGDVYKRLTSYGVGVLAVIPFSLAIFNELEELDCRKRHVLALLLAAVCFGIGVVAGYVMDEVGK